MSNERNRRVLRPQSHGGALLAGGVPGNRGGTGAPPSAIRARYREALLPLRDELVGIANDKDVPPRDRIRAVDAIARIALGSEGITDADLRAEARTLKEDELFGGRGIL